jgi:uncharacterized protein YecE (DUF72 family)
MGWSYKFWINNFYKEKTKTENFLQEYSKHFNTVEVNSTFYRIPTISTLEKWNNQTKKGFLFSLKAPKKITHEKTFETNSDYLDYFLNNVTYLNSKLGPILFQFPPSFKKSKINYLRDLISLLPKKQKYAFEFRNKSWFEESVYNLLTENNIALVLGDGQWLTNFEKITADFVYFRWKGNRKQIKGTTGKVEKERDIDIRKWAEKIKIFLEKAEFFGYFSKYYSGHPPTDVKKILSYLN